MSYSVGRNILISSQSLLRRRIVLLSLRHSTYGRNLNSGNTLCNSSMDSAAKPAGIVAQDFRYFLVLDFEATCLKDEKITPQEIIEFPVLKVSGKTFEVESEFHTFVEPQVHGVSEFCTELTGITTAMVTGQPHLPDVLEMFHEWMKREGLLSHDVKSVFVTCGDWDLRTMLPGQCQYLKLPVKPYFKQWINIKKPFARVTGVYPKGMMSMLATLGLEHEGRHHRGLDDCRNIAKILKALAERRFRFVPTGAKR